jgi:hypothetical protein
MATGVIFIVFTDFAAGLCKRAVASIRKFYDDMPVVVYSDCSTDIPGATVRPISDLGSSEEAGRYKEIKYYGGTHGKIGLLSERYRLTALLKDEWDAALYLDFDTICVSSEFTQGFALAEKFGVALPQDARAFERTDIRDGRYVDDDDRKEMAGAPDLGPCHNNGLIFYSRRNSAGRKIMVEWLKELERKECRGNLALWKVLWREGLAICTLPHQWKVCSKQLAYIKKRKKSEPPIFLHAGNTDVLDWYESDPFFDTARIHAVYLKVESRGLFAAIIRFFGK